MKKLVMGILAHVDAGKTTLSESMLYLAGNIQKLGRVDHKNTFLDTDALEKARGITIFSKQAMVQYQDMQLTLLDTPGHVDFAAETERTLRVLDCAVLVVSATDGVQSHTETLWKLLRKHRVPTFIFVNKMDMPDTDRTTLLAKLEQDLGNGFVDFNTINHPETQETLALCNETAMNELLTDGAVRAQTITQGIANCEIFPTYFGAALKLEGVQDLLDGLQTHMQSPVYPTTFCATVFKITRDAQGNRLTHVKLCGGALKVKQTLAGTSEDGTEWLEKIERLHIYSGQKFTAVPQVQAGEVCAIVGLTQTYAGQTLGAQTTTDIAPMLVPVLTFRVLIDDNTDIQTVFTKLKILEEEDPMLGVVWNPSLAELHVQLMGEIQLEVLQSMMQTRFGMAISFGQGSILYKETIKNTVEGVGHFEPLRHYAEVHLLLEPAVQGSGVQFSTNCSDDVLAKNWKRLILTHLQEKTHLGVLTGSPITDVKITIVSGKAHVKHTEGGDFRQATYRAVRQGLMQAQSVLLEPYYRFALEVPLENVGRAMTDITNLSGTMEAPVNHQTTATIHGTAPVATMRSYHTEVAGYTKGLGKLSCQVSHYAPCHNTAEKVAQIGYFRQNDLPNTPDSVFCTHGAGYTVPWDEVHEKMHVDGVLVKKKEPISTNPISTHRTGYQSSFADDKELLAIFERTYGPIKQRQPLPAQTLGYTKKQPTAVDKITLPSAPQQPEYLLVDGYNIIFAWDDLKKLGIDEARARLTDMLCNFGAFRRCNVVLVFDAYKVKGHENEVEKVNGIHVVYTKEAETADMYIEKTSYQMSRHNRVRVASSDRLEQLIILGHGAVAVSAKSFEQEMRTMEQEMRSYLQQRV